MLCFMECPLWHEVWLRVIVDLCDFFAEGNWSPITEILTHPQYSSRPHGKVQIDVFDVAMMKLKNKIPDPRPHPSDVTLDTIRPICLPNSENFHIDYNQVAINSRSLTATNATFVNYNKCYVLGREHEITISRCVYSIQSPLSLVLKQGPIIQLFLRVFLVYFDCLV